MSLKDKIASDRHTVFMQTGHFADEHTWNGMPFICVADEEQALKRKNNNVNDISWDNNTREVIIYVPKEDFPGRAIPNERGFFDGRPVKILQVQDDMGMYGIALVANYPRQVADE